MKEVLLLALGTLFGWAGNQFLPKLLRRMQGRTGVLVHVETDPAIFESGNPPWIGYAFVLPEPETTPGPPPPGTCQEWWTWARSQKGVDAGITKVRLTVVGDSEVTVVIQALRAAITKRTEPLQGTYIVCTVGGADIVARHIAVDLDGFAEAVTSYVDNTGRSTTPFGFQLTRGAVEVFNIEARANVSCCEWVAELYLLVDGKRQVIHISDDGQPFRTTATPNLSPLHWTGEEWAELHY